MNFLITEEQRKMLANSLIGEKVMVYYNLHKHTFSVQKKGVVVLHADYVKLGDVEFRVREGGKQKVRREKSKNVHAFVIGTLLDYCEYPCGEMPIEPSAEVVTYNPYKYDSFVYKTTEEPVFNAKEVDLINSKNKLFVISEQKIKKGSDKHSGLIFQKGNNSNNWSIVFGGTPSTSYGAKFMKNKAQGFLDSKNVVYSDWENKLSNVELTLKEKYPGAVVKSVVGYSKGGLRAYPASGKYEFVGLIDPSIEGNYKEVSPSSSNTILTYYGNEETRTIKRKWGLSGLKHAMKLIGKQNSVPVNIGHFNQPEEFFKRYKDRM